MEHTYARTDTHAHLAKQTHAAQSPISQPHPNTKKNHSKHTEAQSSRATDSCPHICLKKAYSDTHTHKVKRGRAAARSTHTNHLKHTAAHLQNGTICADNTCTSPTLNIKRRSCVAVGYRGSLLFPTGPKLTQTVI